MVEVTRTTLTPSFVTCNKLDVLTARRSKITLNSYEEVGSMTCLMKRHKEHVWRGCVWVILLKFGLGCYRSQIPIK